MVSRATSTDPVSGNITQVSSYTTGKFVQGYTNGKADAGVNIKNVVRTKETKSDGTIVSHKIAADYDDDSTSDSLSFDVVAKTLKDDKGDSGTTAARTNGTAYAKDARVKIDDQFDAKVLGYSDNSYASLRYILLLGNAKTKKCKAWPLSVARTQVP